MNDSSLLKPSEIAELADIFPSKIRHYTELGLLRPAAFTDGGFKLYHKEETLERLKRISALSDRGLTLEQIKEEFDRSSRTKRILMVDDDKTVTDFYEFFFPEKFPTWEFKIINDGFMAGRTISRWIPDLVILDLMMPGISGFEVCKEIRSDPTLSNVKILAVTGYYGAENKERVIQCGANDYMPKPLDPDKLYSKICELLDLDPNSKELKQASSTLAL